MANHGYIYTKKELSDNEVLKQLNCVNDEFFGGLLKIEQEMFSDGSNFFVGSDYYFENDGILHAWVSDELEYGYYKTEGEEDKKYVEYKDPKIIHKNSVLEFIHGHSHDIFWWLEGVFMENIAKNLNGLTGDDGYEGKYDPKPESYIFDKWKKNSLWFRTKKKILRNGLTFEKSVEQLFKDIKNVERKEKLLTLKK